MLIKKILEALPLTPGPKPPKNVELTAGAAVHELPRCGEVLAVDVYNRKGEPLYRFFSDGHGYITQVVRAFSAFNQVLEDGRNWGGDLHKTGSAIRDFICHVNQERRWRAEDNRRALMKRHFDLFPDYPKDLAAFCEENVFHESVLYVSKLEKNKRRAVCRHCGKSFKVGREVKPGGSGACPKCGWPVTYRADWVKAKVTHKAKICIACKVEGQLLLRYTDV